MSLFFKKQVKRPFLWRAGWFSWSQTHEQSEAARGRRAGARATARPLQRGTARCPARRAGCVTPGAPALPGDATPTGRF